MWNIVSVCRLLRSAVDIQQLLTTNGVLVDEQHGSWVRPVQPRVAKKPKQQLPSVAVAGGVAFFNRWQISPERKEIELCHLGIWYVTYWEWRDTTGRYRIFCHVTDDVAKHSSSYIPPIWKLLLTVTFSVVATLKATYLYVCFLRDFERYVARVLQIYLYFGCCQTSLLRKPAPTPPPP